MESSREIIRQALLSEILPYLRRGNTRLLPDAAAAGAGEDAFFELPTQVSQTHAYHEWLWLLDGTAHLKLDGRIHTMNPGDFCFLPPLLQHCDVYSRHTPAYRSLWFSANNEGVSCLLFTYRPFGEWDVPFSTRVHDSEELRRVRSELQMELAGEGQYRGEIIQGLLIHLAGLILRSLGEAPVSVTQLPPARISTAVQQFLAKHYNEPITLKQIAHATYLSPHHMATLFKKETGTTIFEYLARLRIERATRLLIEDHRPLQEIAQAVGYRDADHFARVFKRIKGLPPSRYGK